MFGLIQLRKLFKLYVAGIIFSIENCRYIRNISIALLAWTPVSLVFDALISAAFSKELAKHVGITEQNLSLLKSGKVKGVRFATLEKICAYLDCQPGDLLEFTPE